MNSRLSCAAALAAYIAAAAPVFAQGPTDGLLRQRYAAPGTQNTGTRTSQAAAAAMAVPTDRNCEAQITAANPSYVRKMVAWQTDGTADHGRILNMVAGTHELEAGYLNDLQIRIERSRCEQANLKRKIDWLIMRLGQQ